MGKILRVGGVSDEGTDVTRHLPFLGFFELSNGCICCTVKDDLLATLEQHCS